MLVVERIDLVRVFKMLPEAVVFDDYLVLPMGRVSEYQKEVDLIGRMAIGPVQLSQVLS